MAEKSNLKISIITATFNSEEYLEETIHSVLSQSYLNIEYIIIDGGSTDRTLEIVEKYTDKIDKVISETDSGIYDAFNKGVRLATGDIIYFLNSDDYLVDQNVISKVVDAFQENNQIDIVYGNVLMLDGKNGYEYLAGSVVKVEELQHVLLQPHQGFFVKRKLFEHFGLFDISYKICGDLDFLVKCFTDKKITTSYLNEKMAVFRVGGISSNPANKKIMIEEQNIIINKYFKDPHNIENNSEDVNSLYRNWLDILLMQKQGISNCLRKYKINKVAIFGTRITGHYLLEDLTRENFNVICFLDNNKNMQGKIVGGVDVYAPGDLLKTPGLVDAVILSIESFRDIEVMNDLKKLFKGQNVHIFSWKDLIKMSLER